MSFVHLHNHSDYSLLDGASRVDKMVDLAAKMEMPAIALTDHGNMFGAVNFFEQCKKKGIKPILGCETYVAFGNHTDKEPGSRSSRSHHLVLLVENATGYRNLVKLVTKAYLDGFYYRPRIDKELLAAHHEGLIGLSACLNGPVCQPLMQGDAEEARRNALAFQEILGKGNFFMEIQDHGLADQDTVRPKLFEIARELDIPGVATNDCHYLRPDDHRAHDILLCIGTGKSRQDQNRLKYEAPEFFLKSEKDMLKRPAFKQRADLLEMTGLIAERVAFELPRGQNYLPRFPLPDGFTLEDYFVRVVEEGWERRRRILERRADAGKLRKPLAAYEERLRAEIDMIRMMQFPGYFLVVWDLIRHAREKGIPVGPGRGSAAGSLVAYCLEITDVDPLEYDLIFERFLNPERITMPDIDIDFCMRRRDEVIDYVTEKYGRENVCQIITFNRMKARAVVRDVGRTLDMSYGEVDKIAKMIPPAINQTLDGALKEVPQLKQAYDGDPRVAELLDIGRALEGLSRQAGVHAAGVVIAPDKLTEFLPLYRSTNDEITTQYAKDEVEKVGLLKMDFLGLRTLTVIYDALALIEADTGRRPDLATLDLEDEATFKLFQEGRTNGVFQFESSGMKDILKRFKPTRFEDLTALNALYRPGSIKGGMIDEFIKCHAGKGKVDYILPALKDILEETYGVIVYQEQVMRIASIVAGFTLGQADTLRKAMGKKQADLMAAQRKAFVDGARERKIPEAKAKHIFDLIEKFAEYGFNKAHSAAYALIAYQTGYLKTHYSVHFMAALLTSERGDTDKVVKYIGECRDMGIRVLPPDVNASGLDFTVSGGDIRFGLAAIKNVGEGAIESILKARAVVGKYTSLQQLLDSVDLRSVNKRVIESLVKSGCFDSLGVRRSAAIAVLDKALERAQRLKADEESGQASLFAMMEEETGNVELPDVPEFEEKVRLAQEKEMLGFYLSGHPLADFEKVLAGFANATTAMVNEAGVSGDVAIGGMVTAPRKVKTRRGDWMTQFVLEDMHGTIEATAFPEATKRHGELLVADRAVLVKGRVEADEERVKLLVAEVLPLDEVAERTARRVFLRIEGLGPSEDALRRFKMEIEGRFHGEECEVNFDCRLPGSVRAIVRPNAFLRVRPSRSFTELCEEVFGKGSVQYAG